MMAMNWDDSPGPLPTRIPNNAGKSGLFLSVAGLL
jgi:hypothetical protein